MEQEMKYSNWNAKWDAKMACKNGMQMGIQKIYNKYNAKDMGFEKYGM